MFGGKCPNFILRAKRDAALSLARGVFEFLKKNRAPPMPRSDFGIIGGPY